MSKPRRHTRRTQSDWTRILKRFESSSLAIHDFCRAEDISLSSFQRWRSRLGTATSADFVELVPTPDASAVSTEWSVEVALPNGVQLRFRG